MTRVLSWLRGRLRRAGGQEGSAVIEFLVVGILLALPIFYLVITLARLQAATYAVTAAARESARVYVASTQVGLAQNHAAAAARLAFEDQGFTGKGSIAMTCEGICLQRGSTATARARLAVDLPLIPDFLRGAVPSSISVSASHTEAVDRFRT